MTPRRGLAAACLLLVAGGLVLFAAERALALFALAGVAGLLATYGWVRRGVGVLLVLGGLVAVGSGWVGIIGGVLTAVAGIGAAVAGGQWPALGRRYAVDRADPWTALDRGDDPTV